MTPTRGDAPDSLEMTNLRRLSPCFEGAVPAVIATTSADGVPNVTYLSCVRLVDDERVALSNQFFSKTAQNLAEDPRASLLLVDPVSGARYRAAIVFERTERRGKVFDKLRADLDQVAALTRKQDLFRLRTADIFRVVGVEQVSPGTAAPDAPRGAPPRGPAPAELMARLAQTTLALNRATDLDSLIGITIRSLGELGYTNTSIMLLDETGERLYTIASSGYDREGVGSEVDIGVGVIGVAAARGAPMRIGSLHQMRKYSQVVESQYGQDRDDTAIPLPSLPDVESRLAVPAMSAGQLVGVIVVESQDVVAFDEDDEQLLTIVASIVAGSIEVLRAEVDRSVDGAGTSRPSVPIGVSGSAAVPVRFYEADGSVFVGGDYVIKGVAGRLLWRVICLHVSSGRVEFTNRELRLDPALELPDFRDNFESRLIMLKRRLRERALPLRIESTGRGRFRLDVETELDLQAVDRPR